MDVFVFLVSALLSSKRLIHLFKSVILLNPQHHSVPYSFHFHSLLFPDFFPISIWFELDYSCEHYRWCFWRQQWQLHAVFRNHANCWTREVFTHTSCWCEGSSFLRSWLSKSARLDTAQSDSGRAANSKKVPK